MMKMIAMFFALVLPCGCAAPVAGDEAPPAPVATIESAIACAPAVSVCRAWNNLHPDHVVGEASSYQWGAAENNVRPLGTWKAIDGTAPGSTPAGACEIVQNYRSGLWDVECCR